MKLKLTILLGTAREGRQSENVAKFVETEAKKLDNVEITYVDVKDHPMTATVPNWQPGLAEPSAWSKIAKESDGFIFVVPEYNHSFPGEFKLLFDTAFEEYKHKPVAIVPVSSGGFGGTRLVETLQNVLIETGAIPVSTVWNVSKVGDMFDESGKVIDEKASGRLKKVLDELVWFGRIMKEAREKQVK